MLSAVFMEKVLSVKRALIAVLICANCISGMSGVSVKAVNAAYNEEQMELTVSGTYTFYNEELNRYLSYEGRSLVLSGAPSNWMLEHISGTGSYVYAENTKLLLDIDNAYVAEGTTIKIWEYTGYDVQIWNINRNANGTCSILYSGNHQYCLGFENEKAVLQMRDDKNPMQEWTIVPVNNTLPKEYLSFYSKDGIVELQLPLDIFSVISEMRLQQWANELEMAYDSFYELTSFMPYPNIIVEAYKTSEYEGFAGWVFDNSNIIHIEREFVYQDLEKMNVRDHDWNFCALHEMGHMFDCGRPWNFETEMLTDLKLAYVLEKNNAAAAPAEFAASDNFYGADIIRAYDILSSDFSENYDIFGCTKRFLEIKEEIGWEPYKQTFHELQEYEADYLGISRQEKFEIFVDLLSRYSGKNIKEYFSSGEWNAILYKLNN